MTDLIGKKAPNLNLPTTGDKKINLTKCQGQIVILYFYPKDATPGCTQEGKDFAQLYKKIQELGGEVFGVSKDSIASHEKFKTKEKYPFDLISDEKGELCKAFEVLKQKSLYGKTYESIHRSTFIISSDSIIKKEWRDVQVQGHAQEVFNFIKTL